MLTMSVGEQREVFEKGDIVEVLASNGLVNYVGEVTGIASWQTETRIPAYAVARLTQQGNIDKRRGRGYHHGERAERLRFLTRAE